MNFSFKNIFYLFIKIILIGLFLSPFMESAFGLNEKFELYSPPEVLSQGGAMTAEASGYLSNYYNPAGLAKGNKKKVEINIIDVEGVLSPLTAAHIWTSQSFGFYGMLNSVRTSPNFYQYFNFATVPSISFRGFSFSFLASHRFAALSNGVNVDVDGAFDVGPTIGAALHFYGKRLKIGVSGKAILRNQLQGIFPHAIFTNETIVNQNMKTGLGIGADVGIMYTLPYRFLPTFALVWQDIIQTQFIPLNILNPLSTAGLPPSIPQSFHFGFSFKPSLGKGVQATISLDVRELQNITMPLHQHFHIGSQINISKSTFLWLGLNTIDLLKFSAGIAYRAPGGNLELGTSGHEIGTAAAPDTSRRVFFRYTVGF